MSALRRMFLLVLMAAALGCAQIASSPELRSILDGAGAGGAGGSDSAQIAEGLKEALRVGSERTVAQTSKSGGFLNDSLLRIALPDELDTMASALRAVGFGSQVDELEVGMNRAAERATGEAKDVLWSAIQSMSISDALGILRGGDHAATDYFRTRTEGELDQRFAPIVSDAMEKVGLYRNYRSLTESYERIPFAKPASVDLESHVRSGALDGIFSVLAEQEARIREDPAARTTELLREVFGGS